MKTVYISKSNRLICKYGGANIENICKSCGKTHYAATTCPYCGTKVTIESSLSPQMDSQEVSKFLFQLHEEEQIIYDRSNVSTPETTYNETPCHIYLTNKRIILVAAQSSFFSGQETGLTSVLREISLESIIAIEKFPSNCLSRFNLYCEPESGKKPVIPLSFRLSEKKEMEIEKWVLKIEELKQQISKQNLANVEKFLDSVKEGCNLISSVESPLSLKKGEQILISAPDITISESRAVRKSTGSLGGASFRVAKGVTVHMAGMRGQSESTEELRDIDQGIFVLTSKRLVFLGSKRTTEINLLKILAIEPSINGIGINASGKSKTLYFKGLSKYQMTYTIDNQTCNFRFTCEVIDKLIDGLIKQIE